MTPIEEKALRIVQKKFPDRYVEYGVRVGDAGVFSTIPRDNSIGIVYDGMYAVDFETMAVVPTLPSLYIEHFTAAMEAGPFYENYDNVNGD